MEEERIYKRNGKCIRLVDIKCLQWCGRQSCPCTTAWRLIKNRWTVPRILNFCSKWRYAVSLMSREPHVTTGWETRLPPESIWSLRRREKSLVLAGNPTRYFGRRNPQTELPRPHWNEIFNVFQRDLLHMSEVNWVSYLTAGTRNKFFIVPPSYLYQWQMDINAKNIREISKKVSNNYMCR
jgi:hypothetical protein